MPPDVKTLLQTAKKSAQRQQQAQQAAKNAAAAITPPRPVPAPSGAIVKPAPPATPEETT